MMIRLFVSAVAALLLVSGCVSGPPAQPVAATSLPRTIGALAKESSYTRAVQTEPDCFVRQTGYRVFLPVSGRGPAVELVAAIHIAEAGYYEQLQRRLDAADLVLYEGVTSGSRQDGAAVSADAPPQARPSKNPTYQRLADVLGLISQERAIRYAPPRYQRCDMTIEQMRDLLAAESAQGGAEAQAANAAHSGFHSLRGILSGKAWETRLLFLLLDYSSTARTSSRLRIAIHNPDQASPKSLHPRLKQLIIDDRDEYVMNHLGEILARPAGPRHIALFYGAGHMPGMERRLRAMGYRPAGPVRWVDAITVRPAAEGLNPRVIAEIVGEYE